jgi:predicted metal-dependent peptidase
MIRDVIENKCKVTGWGKLSGEAVEEIMLKNKRKVNITPIIAGFGATVRCRKRVSTRLRVNKRYEYLPGYRTDRKTKMLFAIDSSYSMSESDIRKGCEILHNFYKKTEIDLAFWDAKMVKPQKLKKNFQKITAPGRGGTDPHCIGEYLKAHNMHYDGVVIFTDCYWEWKENNLGSHIFVISSEKEYTVPKFVKHHASIQQLTHVFDD